MGGEVNLQYNCLLEQKSSVLSHNISTTSTSIFTSSHCFKSQPSLRKRNHPAPPRFTVRAWCTNYETTHRWCPPAVVAVEWRLDERCGDCREPAMQPWMKYEKKNSRA